MGKSIKLQNNNYWDSKSIVHNQVVLQELLDKLSHENLIFARKTNDQYIPKDVEQTIKYDQLVSKIGTGMSFDGYGVTIESDDIKSVSVVGSFFNKGWGTINGVLRIYKNSDMITSIFFGGASHHQISAIFDVKKGDVISIRLTCSSGNTTINNSNYISFFSVKS